LVQQDYLEVIKSDEIIIQASNKTPCLISQYDQITSTFAYSMNPAPFIVHISYHQQHSFWRHIEMPYLVLHFQTILLYLKTIILLIISPICQILASDQHF